MNDNNKNNSEDGPSRPFAARDFAPSRATTLSRPLVLARLGGGNVISLQSLPRRRGGDGGDDAAPSRPLIRREPFDGGSGGRAPPGSPGFVPRFVRPPADGRFGGGAGGGGGRFGARPSAGGRGGGGGRFGARQQKGRGGGRGGRERGSGKGKKEGKRGEKNGNEADMDDIGQDRLLEEYVENFDAGGVERAYTPSTTLESLVGWGPAVATNTAMGQADTAVQNLRVMGGGRGHAEKESGFELIDVQRSLSSGTPIYYSNAEQKRGVKLTLCQGAVEEAAEMVQEMIVRKLQRRHGENYWAFVADYNERGGEEGIKKKAREIVETTYLSSVEGDKRSLRGNEKTREAINNYAVKGDYPQVKYAEDLWGKLAMYAAHERSYRPADAVKLEQKVRTLIKT